MTAIHTKPDILEKLRILSRDSQYDLACACGTRDDEHRTRSADHKWIYPVVLPDGRRTFLFKTLVSNVCANDCRYCPLRAEKDPRRCTLSSDEIAAAFMHYLRAGLVSGIFLTSGVTGSPDAAMERINGAARILRRREGFKGYMHLKVIPGASDAAVTEAVSLASAVSINIETAGERHFRTLTARKDYLRDVVRPLKLISSLTDKNGPYCRVHQTTQFVVGAAGESDSELVRYSGGLYRKLGMHRVYFSAYQRGCGDPSLPGERSGYTNEQMLTREHRLYQTDWLLRKYGFGADEIPFDASGNLSLDTDPKEQWARRHPEFFPVNINRADRNELLRVPGLGLVGVRRILSLRNSGGRVHGLEEIGRVGKVLARAREYVVF